MLTSVGVLYLVGSARRILQDELLNIEQLIDIDMVKFEKDNNVKLNYILYSLLGKDNSASKSAGKTSRSKSEGKSKKTKKKVTDYHINIGLSKRMDPLVDDDRRDLRMKWEKINIKRDHLVKFTQKDKRHRVL